MILEFPTKFKQTDQMLLALKATQQNFRVIRATVISEMMVKLQNMNGAASINFARQIAIRDLAHQFNRSLKLINGELNENTKEN